jgi:hypothetical protein
MKILMNPSLIGVKMIISYEEVDHLIWTSSGTWINGEYYRQNILKKYVLNNWCLKNDSDFSGIF